MIEKLRIRNDLILSKCINKKDNIYLKQSLIKKILSDDKCFFKISYEDAFNILNDLGYNDSDAMNIYKILLSPKEYEKIEEVY